VITVKTPRKSKLDANVIGVGLRCPLIKTTNYQLNNTNDMEQNANQTDARGNKLNPLLPPVFNTINFEREKVATYARISKEMLTDLKMKVEQSDDDFIYDLLHAQLVGYIYSNMSEERDLVYWCKRPTFFEWLFRKSKKVVFKLQVKDILLNPPKDKNTARIYQVEYPS
jgi:hypothetical protein